MWLPVYDEIHPRFTWMRDYLARIAPQGKLPGLQHLDLKAMGSVRPYINLVDVVRSGTDCRFRYRLIGSQQTLIAQRDITGLYIEEAVLPLFLERIRTNMQTCVDQRKAYYDVFAMPHPDRDFIRTERIYFPLASDGSAVDVLMVLNCYPDGEDGVAGNEPLPPLPPAK